MAGGDRRRQAVEPALDVLRREAESVELWPTTGPGTATELSRRAGGRADLVVACGGDGTINEVVNGLAGSDTPLGVLPAGTANLLARELGLPMDLGRAAAELVRFVPRRLSLGRLECDGPRASRYFLLLCGAGLDAGIVYRLSPRLKARLGVGAYWIAGLSGLGRRLEAFEVLAGDDRRFQCTFALASKLQRYGGGLRIARGAHLLANDLEVVLFPSRSTLRFLVYLAAVLLGLRHRLSDVTVLRARRIELRAPRAAGRIYVEVDGELAGRLPATIEIVDDALSLLTPPGFEPAGEGAWKT